MPLRDGGLPRLAQDGAAVGPADHAFAGHLVEIAADRLRGDAERLRQLADAQRRLIGKQGHDFPLAKCFLAHVCCQDERIATLQDR